ncbi:hypothetical protein K502DRAFT_360354 [Neoconidiobolus thromboides FSU 785]|nr:hypothetical protein K502DRAFT_360354 [Neoconidiobolus thromboides FSU 785]
MKFQAIILLTASISALAAGTNSMKDVKSIIQESKANIVKKHGGSSSSNVAAPKYILSNDIAPSKTSLGAYKGEFNVANNNYQCREGDMYCDYSGNGFWTCAQGSWVYRNCGPGTKCVQNGGNLYCDYA